MSFTALDLYRAATVLGAPAIGALLALRRARGKEDGARLAERRGAASLARPPGPLVWLHAASVGEAQSALALIERVLGSAPRSSVLITTGTVTSARLLSERLSAASFQRRAFHQYVPVDRPRWVGCFLDHWRPDLALWIESELWPNLVLETSRRGVPMVLLNARMSERSFAGWRRWPALIRPLLGSFRRVLAQSEADAARYRALGAGEIAVTGSFKYDAEPLPVEPAALHRLGRALGARPRWLAASTHPGEEAQVAEAHRRLKARHPELVTLLVPRHPQRGAEIAAMLRGLGLAVARRSTGEALGLGTELYLADTMGELGLFYRLAGIVFVGGSLVPHGGQNLLEPACLGCVVLHGPHVQNFHAIAADLAAAGASETVADAPALALAVGRLLDDEAVRRARGEAARAAAEAGRGALDSVIAALRPELKGLDPAPETGIARA